MISKFKNFINEEVKIEKMDEKTLDSLKVNLMFRLGEYRTYILSNIEYNLTTNKIEYKNNTVIKNTNNPGEIYWYNNMPEDINYLFPTIIRADGEILEMEKIRGINYSYLYTNCVLREEEIDILIEKLKNESPKKVETAKNKILKENKNFNDKLTLISSNLSTAKFN